MNSFAFILVSSFWFRISLRLDHTDFILGLAWHSLVFTITFERPKALKTGVGKTNSEVKFNFGVSSESRTKNRNLILKKISKLFSVGIKNQKLKVEKESKPQKVLGTLFDQN